MTTLIFDQIYASLAGESANVSAGKLEIILNPISLPSQTIRDSVDDSDLRSSSLPPAIESDAAYFFHTSGTSSGLPKPIAQSHRAAVGVLPCLPNGQKQATFTTTPLYHGGIADCFRAWTSSALIWLFPGKELPITESNVVQCLECAKSAELIGAPPIKFFSSVPYVLQMLCSEPAGVEHLQEMDLVGVGGAALPKDVGDDLVRKGVNLLSRFGSAECGFLMSSHRKYKEDGDWQYLRSHGSKLLHFETQLDGSGLAELVILSQWPHMAKRNRGDGSFATADLFEPHSHIQDAWKYHSRADSQLTLITGKKFDPAPLEAAIAASSILSDVLIFGNGRNFPGALLFRSAMAKEMPEEACLDRVWPLIMKLNQEGQAHTRLVRAMLVIMPFEVPGLEKSSKGTILRGQAEARYEKEISQAYDTSDSSTNGNSTGPMVPVDDQDIPIHVLKIVRSVLNTNDRIPEDADLFAYGVDSVACMRIRATLQNDIIGSDKAALPLNIVYDCSTIKR